MVWEGARTVAIDLDRTEQYNAHLPKSLAITPGEAAQRAGEAH
jgi:hypothetical protein